MSNVGIVIVSHSAKVAEGAADMVRQMVGDEVPLAYAGGNADGGLGHRRRSIMEAIDRAWSEAGVAIMVDLGGAETNSEMAIEMLDDDRRALVVVCNAPIVEGAVIAAAEASGGSSLRDGEANGRRVVAAMIAKLMPTTKFRRNRMPHQTVTGSAILTNAVGLHARPSVKLTQLAKSFAAIGRYRARCERSVGRREEPGQGHAGEGPARFRRSCPGQGRGCIGCGGRHRVAGRAAFRRAGGHCPCQRGKGGVMTERILLGRPAAPGLGSGPVVRLEHRLRADPLWRSRSRSGCPCRRNRRGHRCTEWHDRGGRGGCCRNPWVPSGSFVRRRARPPRHSSDCQWCCRRYCLAQRPGFRDRNLPECGG